MIIDAVNPNEDLIGYADFSDEEDSVHYIKVFEHKETKSRIAYPSTYLTAAQRSTLRFRRRMRFAIVVVPFTRFITFTYSNEFLPVESIHVSKLLYRWRQYLRDKGQRKLSYVWRIDWGSENERPHFHMIANQHVSWENLVRWWGRGYVWIEQLESRQKVAEYVGRYMSKMEERRDSPRRRYGCSRDVPKTPPSEFKLLGWFRGDEYQEVVLDHNESLKPFFHFEPYFFQEGWI